MRIFKITFNKHYYDQYDAFIIAAEEEEEAIAILREKFPEEAYSKVQWPEGYTVEEIKNPKQGIILGSYNAG